VSNRPELELENISIYSIFNNIDITLNTIDIKIVFVNCTSLIEARF